MRTPSSAASRAAAHREYRVLLGLTYPVFVAGVALRRLGLLPAEPARPASFIAAVGLYWLLCLAVEGGVGLASRRAAIMR